MDFSIFLLSKIIHDLSTKAASAAQIQEAEKLLGREHFVEAERVALHHGEKTNG